jgi:hypothetical protein
VRRHHHRRHHHHHHHYYYYHAPTSARLRRLEPASRAALISSSRPRPPPMGALCCCCSCCCSCRRRCSRLLGPTWSAELRLAGVDDDESDEKGRIRAGPTSGRLVLQIKFEAIKEHSTRIECAAAAVRLARVSSGCGGHQKWFTFTISAGCPNGRQARQRSLADCAIEWGPSSQRMHAAAAGAESSATGGECKSSIKARVRRRVAGRPM